MQLIIRSNNVANALTLDLSNYVDVQDGHGLDPQDPKFTNKVFARSLLRPGASLSLTQLTEKEQVFPLLLNQPSFTALATLIQQINQVLETPGATLTWQTDGASQATTFDAIGGQLDVQYSFRKEQAHWCSANLRFFAQPFGRTAGPRPYAAASAVGPLLMISPYASSGAQILGASTQASVAGYGGRQQGASSGVFYWGSPSLAGDAPAQLQISYVGPLPNTATLAGCVPYAAVSLLPDAFYRPLITTQEIQRSFNTTAVVADATVPGGQYFSIVADSDVYSFVPIPGGSAAAVAPTQSWAGQHRLFAIARASGAGGGFWTLSNSLTPQITYASVTAVGGWVPYDLGTFSLRASEPPQAKIQVGVNTPAGGIHTVDLCGFVMLPDNATWFLNPTTILGSQYGYGNALGGAWASAPYTNTLLIDDTLPDQFIYSGPSQTFAPSPIGSVPSSARITQYSRGLVPAPDPKNGLPIIAIMGVGQLSVPSIAVNTNVPGNPGQSGASWPNQQNLRTMAQVNVLERARYVLP